MVPLQSPLDMLTSVQLYRVLCDLVYWYSTIVTHYGNNPMKCVNFKLYLFIKVIIEFSNLIVIVNQQGTLRIVHGRVDPSTLLFNSNS